MREIRKKIITIGSYGVGKTSLIKQFVLSEFKDEYLSTIGVRVDKKSVILEDAKVHLLLWDLAGEIMENKAYQSYLTGSAGVIGVFDITRPESYKQIKNHLTSIKKSRPEINVILLGNKFDLYEEGLHDLSAFDCFTFTSAKSGKNVNNSFTEMARMLLKQITVETI